MTPATLAVLIVVGSAAMGLLVACGDRTGLGGESRSSVLASDAGFDGPTVEESGTHGCPPASCPELTRGTWRLETAAHEPAGYLFAYDGRSTCNGSADAFLITLAPTDGGCDRNGDMTMERQTPTTLRFSTDNLGGSFGPACGDPSGERLQATLTRAGCDGVSYALSVHDSRPGSPFDVSVTATRCRCDVNWVPCVQPLPADPCAP